MCELERKSVPDERDCADTYTSLYWDLTSLLPVRLTLGRGVPRVLVDAQSNAGIPSKPCHACNTRRSSFPIHIGAYSLSIAQAKKGGTYKVTAGLARRLELISRVVSREPPLQVASLQLVLLCDGIFPCLSAALA